jgi:hypothetical protein
MLYMRLAPAERAGLIQDLAAMADYLQSAFHGLRDEQVTLPGPNGAFSPVEQVWHLADLEAEGFGTRIDRLLHEAAPQLPDFDGTAIARQRNYRARSLAEGLERFASARRANLVVLMAVPDAAWWNTGSQAGVGAVSLCDMPAFLLQHDQAHMAEIREWQLLHGNTYR